MRSHAGFYIGLMVYLFLKVEKKFDGIFSMVLL